MLDQNNLNEEQQVFVVKYKTIYNKLVSLQEKMDSMRKESDVLIEELETLRKQEKKILKTSLIRELDIGKNYFSHINPRRKKLLTTLLNSYIKALKKTEEVTELITALDLYFKNSSGGKKFEDLEDKELNFSEGTL